MVGFKNFELGKKTKMQICKKHWEQIRTRIKELGLSHLGAQDAHQAFEQIKGQLEGRDDPKDFDPLMSCNWMICSHALELAGPQLLIAGEDGKPRCPLCEAWKHREDSRLPNDEPVTLEMFEHYWITGPTFGVLAHCRELGLVPREN